MHLFRNILYLLKGKTVLKKLYIICMVIVPNFCFADVVLISEVTVAPKSVNAVANISSGISFVNVRMDLAKVDMFIGKPLVLDKESSFYYKESIKFYDSFRNLLKNPKTLDKTDESRIVLLPLHIKAIFELVNESTNTLKLTVGFPISNAKYSSFHLLNFTVVSNGTIREIFHSRSSYKKYISEGKGDNSATLPTNISENIIDFSVGKDLFQNMIFWEETFTPGERKKIEVTYEVDIPLQENKIVQSRVIVQKGGRVPAPIAPDGAPIQFLQKIHTGSYFFFDYYLTSGASWAGSIGFEEITLHFDRWWQGLEFYSTIKEDKLAWSNRTFKPNTPTTVTYQFRDKEPTENIYFAIRPGKNNSPKPLLQENRIKKLIE